MAGSNGSASPAKDSAHESSDPELDSSSDDDSSKEEEEVVRVPRDFSLEKSAASVGARAKAEAVAKWAAPAARDETAGSDTTMVKGKLPTRLSGGHVAKTAAALADKELKQVTNGNFKSAITKDQEMSRAKKKGDVRNWHDMKVPELTPELRQDLKMLQLRNYMDPKRFYKTSDSKGLPKVFQVGTVVEGFAESRMRLTRKERKPTIVDQVLSDRGVRDYTKRVFSDLQKQRANKLRFKKRAKGKGKGKSGGGGRRSGR